MQSLIDFIRDTVVTPRGLPDPTLSALERTERLDDRMRTLETLTWSLIPAAGAVGAAAFRGLLVADPATPTGRLAARATVCTWSLIAIAMAKLWHARAQEHTELMKQQLLLSEQLEELRRRA